MFKKKVLEVKGVKINLSKGRLKLPEKALKKLKKNIKKKTVGEKDGTYILQDGITYAKFGKKETCYRNAYIAKDYLVVPLTIDKMQTLELLSKDDIRLTYDSEDIEVGEEVKEEQTITSEQRAVTMCEMIREALNPNKEKEAVETTIEGEYSFDDSIDQEFDKEQFPLLCDELERVDNLLKEFDDEDVDNENIFNYTLQFEICDEVTLIDVEDEGYFIYDGEIFIKHKKGNGCSPRRLRDGVLLTTLVDTKKSNMYGLKVTKLILQ